MASALENRTAASRLKLDQVSTVLLGRPGSVRRLLLARLLLMPVVLLGATFLVYMLVDLSPENPAFAKLGIFANATERQRFAVANHLNQPLLVRYLEFINDTIHLRLGNSLVRPETVGFLLRISLPPTLQLTLLASIIAVTASVVLASAAALQDGKLTDRVISSVVAFLQAAPDFVVGIVVVEIFGVILHVVPAEGYQPWSAGIGPWLDYLIVPSAVLALPFIASMTRVLRASLVDELSKDYVRTALGAGVPKAKIVLRNILPNAVLPALTILGLRIGWLLGGAILVENVFNIPGLGMLLITAVNNDDLSIVRAIALLGGITFVLVNVVVDVAYILVNPRLRRSAGAR
jgi:peptide/nickel transport system permease protein